MTVEELDPYRKSEVLGIPGESENQGWPSKYWHLLASLPYKSMLDMEISWNVVPDLDILMLSNLLTLLLSWYQLQERQIFVS